MSIPTIPTGVEDKVEIVLNFYVAGLVKTQKGYSAYQIDHICETGAIVSGDSYAAKLKGYYSVDKVTSMLNSSSTELVGNIRKMIYEITQDDDFVLL
jgi:hypothetical protein